MAVVVLLVLVETPEAYVAFGLIFALVIVLSLGAALHGQQRPSHVADRGWTPAV